MPSVEQASGVALKKFLKKQGLTQKQFAARMGCSQATISHYISGRRYSLPQTVLIAFIEQYDLPAFTKVFLRPKG